MVSKTTLLIIGAVVCLILLFLFGFALNSEYAKTKELKVALHQFRPDSPIITSCRNLTMENATYNLAKDINISSASCFHLCPFLEWARNEKPNLTGCSIDLDCACLVVQADNITINGNGHSINGDLTNKTAGIYTNHSYTTIKDLSINAFDYNLFIDMAHGASIKNNSIYGGGTYGAFFQYSNNSIFSNNTLTDNSYGMAVDYRSVNVSVENNTIIGNHSRHNAMSGSTAILDARFYNNTISGYAYALRFESVFTSVVSENRLDADQYGIYVTHCGACGENGSDTSMFNSFFNNTINAPVWLMDEGKNLYYPINIRGDCFRK